MCRYEQTISLQQRYGAVGGKVYLLLKRLASGKAGPDELFDRLNPTNLNGRLNKLMPKLSAKVLKYRAPTKRDGATQRDGLWVGQTGVCAPSLWFQQPPRFARSKVFRTYNASIVLGDELSAMPEGFSLEQQQMFYTDANTRVALLCNHQRAVGADHASSLAKMEAKKAIDEKSIELLAKVTTQTWTQSIGLPHMECRTRQPDDSPWWP